MALTFDPETHTYRRNGQPIPGVSEVLESVGMTDFSAIAPGVLANAGARGHAVHAALEYFDQGDLDVATMDPALTPWLRAWENFVNDTGVRLDLIEAPVCSTRAPHYAGTPDRTGKHDGRAVLIDIKTGAAKPADVVQVAAYCATFSIRGEHKTGWIVYLHPGVGRGYTLKALALKEQFDAALVFQSALAVHNWKLANGVLDAPKTKPEEATENGTDNGDTGRNLFD